MKTRQANCGNAAEASAVLLAFPTRMRKGVAPESGDTLRKLAFAFQAAAEATPRAPFPHPSQANPAETELLAMIAGELERMPQTVEELSR